MKNRLFGQNVQLFRANHDVSAFGWTFQEEVAKSASFREKASEIVDLAKTCNFFEQTTICRRLGQPFSKKLQKVLNFARKHGKSSIWPKNATFSSTLPRFAVWVNFSVKSCKKFLISRKSMKNRRFGQNVKPSRANHHVSAFGSTFQQKVLHYREKHEKSSIWPKCATFSNKLTRFAVWVNFWVKSCKKCFISRKSMKNRRFDQTVKPSRVNHDVFAFGWTFKQKVLHFAKKHEKSSIWPKCSTFSSKPRCLGVWVNFSARSCKKCLISRKTIRNRRFGQKLQLLRANNHVSTFGSTFQ